MKLHRRAAIATVVVTALLGWAGAGIASADQKWETVTPNDQKWEIVTPNDQKWE
jgi:hypothetical protein